MVACRPFTIVVACLAGLAVVAPASADAARFPKKRITYHDKSSFSAAVKEAVRLWNAAGTPVRLKRASRRRADIRIFDRRRLTEAGRPVAGRGGGVDLDGRRQRGFVKLSTSALGGEDENIRVNVAAHELGHALGLGHLPQACSLMNEYPDSLLQSACPPPSGQYRCGPQRADARALAKLYRGRARFPAAGGTCPLPQPPVEVLAPPPALTVPAGTITDFAVRNQGTTTWEQYDLSVYFTDAAGNITGGPCSFDGTPMASSMNEDRVAPGEIATFGAMLCGQPGTTETLHLRLFADPDGAGRPFGVGPVRTVTVTFL